uniref:SET domain-containing protein n=1 Tax=Chromera velia CCMP2878 TaxID=1169474 RepID=A0A0G4GF21_9ALVE|eukprot:Cvel_4618.t1-p1 / transcript=Cvel_4618.t1 / gene=Cvel_4618 / organism=Chromera_velia_CCMP2878 / gene_product=hypothetical protein / transcript_product=hypothetical protein / location=Cvel_scaffold203:45655-49522(+) / protein_length=886 / sequence_SO=supercontig / SO=protein_coding / is_pseudo=false
MSILSLCLLLLVVGGSAFVLRGSQHHRLTGRSPSPSVPVSSLSRRGNSRRSHRADLRMEMQFETQEDAAKFMNELFQTAEKQFNFVLKARPDWRDRDGIRGLFATKDMKKGDSVVVTPVELCPCFTGQGSLLCGLKGQAEETKRVYGDYRTPLSEDDLRRGLTWDLRMAVALFELCEQKLMSESVDVKTEWDLLSFLLPDSSELTTPLTQPDIILRRYGHERVMKGAKMQRQRLHDCIPWVQVTSEDDEKRNEEFEKTFQGYADEVPFPLGVFEWAFAVMRSRVFKLASPAVMTDEQFEELASKVSQDDKLRDPNTSITRGQFEATVTGLYGILPIIDLANHSSKPNCQYEIVDMQYDALPGGLASGQIRLFTTRDVKEGEEMTISYSGYPEVPHYSLPLFLAQYGFLPSQRALDTEGNLELLRTERLDLGGDEHLYQRHFDFTNGTEGRRGKPLLPIPRAIILPILRDLVRSPMPPFCRNEEAWRAVLEGGMDELEETFAMGLGVVEERAPLEELKQLREDFDRQMPISHRVTTWLRVVNDNIAEAEAVPSLPTCITKDALSDLDFVLTADESPPPREACGTEEERKKYEALVERARAELHDGLIEAERYRRRRVLHLHALRSLLERVDVGRLEREEKETEESMAERESKMMMDMIAVASGGKPDPNKKTFHDMKWNNDAFSSSSLSSPPVSDEPEGVSVSDSLPAAFPSPPQIEGQGKGGGDNLEEMRVPFEKIVGSSLLARRGELESEEEDSADRIEWLGSEEGEEAEEEEEEDDEGVGGMDGGDGELEEEEEEYSLVMDEEGQAGEGEGEWEVEGGVEDYDEVEMLGESSRSANAEVEEEEQGEGDGVVETGRRFFAPSGDEVEEEGSWDESEAKLAEGEAA